MYLQLREQSISVMNSRFKITYVFSFLMSCLFFLNISWSQATPDTLIQQAASIQYIKPEKALNILDSIEVAEYNNLSFKQLCNIYRTKGNVYWFLSKLHTSIRFYRKSMALGKANNDLKEVITCESEIGYVFSDLGQNDSAIFYLRSSIEKAEEINDSIAKHRSLDYLAHCYDNNGDYEKAIQTYQSIIPFFARTGTRRNLHVIFTNLGNTYQKFGANDTAQYYYNVVLSEADSATDLDMIASIEMSMAQLHSDIGNFSKAIDYLYQSRRHYEKIGSVTGKVESKVVEGNLYFDNFKFQECIPIYKEALADCEETEDLKRQIVVIEKMALAFDQIGNYKEAYSSLSRLRVLEDSLQSYLDLQFLQDMNAKYKSEQKEKQITLLNKEQELKNAQLEKKEAEVDQANMQKLIFGIGLSLVIVFAILIMIGLRQKQKANSILKNQKAQIEEKNKEIVDSITYAKRIQMAILPPDKLMNNLLPKSFVYYQPKDIVAGDFYWLEEKNDTLYLAVADCTGHGVPGAMVSVICNNGLNRSLREFELTKPGEILDKTRELVISEFEKSVEDVKDGMDIALVSLQAIVWSKEMSVGDQTAAKYILQYAGAHNPLWIVRGDELIEYKADKQPIGKFEGAQAFNTNEIELFENDRIYLFSDGFADQFGGEKGKKFKSANFKKLLLNIQYLSIEDQKDRIEQEFAAWKGDYEQLDDVCVIGVEV